MSPACDPWLASWRSYKVAWPGWYPYPGTLVWRRPYLSLPGVGFGIGFSAALDGAYIPTGDSIGMADMQFITTTGTTPGATLFTTEVNIYYRGGGQRGVAAECAARSERQPRWSLQPPWRNEQVF